MSDKNNAFSMVLQRILLLAGIKNYVVAKVLKYDVSYISKWISGKAIPSKKYIGEICKNISLLTAENCLAEQEERLRIYMGIGEEEELADAVEKKLKDAYYMSIGEASPEEYANNASVRIHPDHRRSMVLDFREDLDFEEPLKIAVMADLFAMNHSSKLSLSGIEENAFTLKKLHDNLDLHFVIDLSEISGKKVYDVILLIHLLTGYSLTNFQLSQSTAVKDKLIIAVENNYSSVTMLDGEQGFLASTVTRERDVVNRMYRHIVSKENPEKTVFSKTKMEDLLLHHEYIQSMLSGKTRWLIGHITEQFISPELSARLREKVFSENPQVQQESRIAETVASKILRGSKMRVMIYDSALTNFMLSGELDFYNHKIILSPEERRHQLEYMKEVFDVMGAGGSEIRLIHGGFSDDFRYITNPCMFLSEAISYVRLENQKYVNNILLVLDKNMRNIFDEFFEEIWENRKDVVLTEQSAVLSELDRLIEAGTILSDIE